MSTTIDEKVVEMRFDNQNFEKNISTTMTTLEKFKASFNFDKIADAFSSVEDSASGVNMSPLSGAVDKVKTGFSALEVVAITALANITNSAINTGKELIASLTTDQIVAGWEKFGDKTTSVGTLISQGFEMSEVEEQLEKLMWYTDETSYNFIDMVSTIGKFTASGQGLAESNVAMMGIANWAAMSGQNAETASRAMYQLAQAMSKGALRLDDFKSVQNANMDTKQFRETSIEAAKALGHLREEADGTYTIMEELGDGTVQAGKNFTFNELFTSDALTKEQWLDSETMMATFSKYASGVNAIRDVVDNGIELNIDGEKTLYTFDTASEAIQFLNDNWDAYTETLGSAEAENLKFGMTAFAAAQEARTFKDTIDSVKDAVSSQWVQTFEHIFGNYEEAKEFWTDLANAMYDVFTASHAARNEMLEAWKEAGGRDDLLRAFWNTWDGIVAIMDTVKGAFQEVFPPMTGERLAELTKKVADLTEKFKMDEEQTRKLHNTFKGIFSIFGAVKKAVGAVLNGFKPLFSLFEGGNGSILDAAESFGLFLSRITDSLDELGVFEFITESISKAVSALVKVLKKLGNKILPAVRRGFEKVGKILEDVLGLFGALAGGAVDGILTVFTNFMDLFDPKPLEDVSSAIGELETGVDKLIGTSKEGDGIFSNLLSGITNLFTGIPPEVSSSITGIVDAISTGLGGIGSLIFGTIVASLDATLTTVETYAPQIWELIMRAANDVFDGVQVIIPSIELLVNRLFVDSVDENGEVSPSVVTSIRNLLSSALSGIFGSLGGILTTLATSLTDNKDAILTPLRSLLNSILDIILDLLGTGGNLISKTIDGLADIIVANIPTVLESIEKVFNALFNPDTKSQIGSSNAMVIGAEFSLSKSPFIKEDSIIDRVLDIYTIITKALADNLDIILDGIGVVIDAISKNVSKIIQPIGGLITNVLNEAAKFIENNEAFIDAVLRLFGAVMSVVLTLDVHRLIKGITKPFNTLSEVFETINKGFKKSTSATMLEIAIAVLVLAGACLILANIPADKLTLVAGAIVSFMIGLGIATRMVSKVGSMSTDVTKGMIKLAVAVFLISAAFALIAYVINESELTDTQLFVIAGGVVAAIYAIVGAMFLLSKIATSVGTLSAKIGSVSGMLLSFAVSLAIIGGVIIMLSKLSWDELARGLAGVAGAILILVGMAGLLALFKTNLSSLSVNLLSLGAALFIMAGALLLISSIPNIGEALKTLGIMAAILVGMGLILGLVTAFLGSIVPAALGILAISAALVAFAGAMWIINQIPITEIWASVLSLMLALLLMMGVAVALAPAIPIFGGFALAVLAIGGAALLVSLSLLVFAEALKSLAELSGPQINTIGDNLLKLLDIALGLMGGLFTVINAFGAHLILTVISWIDLLLTTLAGRAALWGAQLAAILVNIAFGALAYLSEFILQFLKVIFPNIQTGAVELFAGVAESSTASVMAAFGIESPSTVFAEIGKYLIQGFINGITDKLKELWDLISETAGKVVSTFEKVLKINSPSKVFDDLGSGTMEGYMDGVSGKSGELDALLADIASDIPTSFDSSSLNLDDDGSDLMSSWMSGARSMSGDVSDTGFDMSNLFKDSLMSDMDSFGISGFNMTGEFNSGLGSRSADIKRTGAAQTGQFIAGVASKYNDVVKAGIDTAEGLMRGMNSKYNDVVQSGRSLGGAAQKGVTTTLSIHSPSRVMMRLGEYVGDGLRIGILNTKAAVTATAEDMGYSTMDALAVALTSASDLFANDNLDLSPTISPVVDLDNVNRGANAINSLLNSDKSMGLVASTKIGVESSLAKLQNGIAVDNTSVTKAIDNLNSEVGSLKDAMLQFQIVLDTGTLVGEMVNPMDRALGGKYVYAKRGI